MKRRAVRRVWSLSKYHRMANHTIDDLAALHAEAQRHQSDIADDQHLLRSCFEGAGLALTIGHAQVAAAASRRCSTSAPRGRGG
ncbi:MAG TPA: hypothetical protein VLI90_08875 [Tepidisphaeraceae bacterium]|nr:hypothetical protein [Tepidisphaeraceae bacterium]